MSPFKCKLDLIILLLLLKTLHWLFIALEMKCKFLTRLALGMDLTSDPSLILAYTIFFLTRCSYNSKAFFLFLETSQTQTIGWLKLLSSQRIYPVQKKLPIWFYFIFFVHNTLGNSFSIYFLYLCFSTQWVFCLSGLLSVLGTLQTSRHSLCLLVVFHFRREVRQVRRQI